MKTWLFSMGLWVALAFVLLLAGCTDPDPYYRADPPPACTFSPPNLTVCANPACFVCLGYDGLPLGEAVVPARGCQIQGSVGVTLCVNDCAACDL